MPAGKLIVFEGPDGVGKTTLATTLAADLAARGISHSLVSFPGRAEGTLGAHVYALHHDPRRFSVQSIRPAALQALHVAAHIDAIEQQILPTLASGRWVILDRYWWSMRVYGDLAGVSEQSLEAMVALERAHWGDVRPDAILLVLRDAPLERNHGQYDHDRLLKTYRRLAETEALVERVHTLVNHGDAVDAVRAMFEALSDLLPAGPHLPTGAGSHNQGSGSSSLSSHSADQTSTSERGDSSGGSLVVIAPLAPVVPTVVYETFWYFAAERQRIFFRRLEGQPQPWTHDPILAMYKFTNSYRASDRASQYLIRRVAYAGTWDADDLFFRTVLFRLFNRIETWQRLEANLGEISWASYDFRPYGEVLGTAAEWGHPLYTAAYIIPPPSVVPSVAKYVAHLRLLERMMADRVGCRLQEARSMRQAFEILRGYRGIGDFLAYQLLVDLNYGPHLDFSEMDFVVPGPGAREGIGKCFASLGGLNEVEIVKFVTDRQEREFEARGIRFDDLWGRTLHLVDCQNLLCEVAKYARIRHPDVGTSSGRKRIKQRFRPSMEEIEYWYPPKWGLNDRIPKRGGAT